MAYRVDDLEIPPDEPFRHDALERRPLVEFLCALIGRAGGPFVMALDSPWGSGNTTLVKIPEPDIEIAVRSKSELASIMIGERLIHVKQNHSRAGVRDIRITR